MPKVYKDFDRQTWIFTKYSNPVVYQPSYPDRLLNLELFWTFLDVFRGNKKAYTILGAGIGHGVGAVLRTILEASTPQCEGITNSTNVKLSNLEEAHASTGAWAFIVLYFVPCLIQRMNKLLKIKQLSKGVVPRVGLEPTQPIGQGILSPSCLPFHHLGNLMRTHRELLSHAKVR